MATFSASPIPSTFGNVLFNPMAVDQAVQARQQNNLLMQGERQRQGSNEMDQIGRAAAGVLTLPPEQQEAGYNAAVQRLQSYGYAKNAPAFPGADKLRGIVNQTLPVETQYQLGLISSPGLDAALKAANAPLPGASPAAGGAAATSGGASLGRAESGGNPAAVNAGGYSGTYQMGKARMAELGYYQPAPGEDMKSPDWPGKVSVPGFAVSNQADYLKNPAAQNAVFNQHMANIDQAIGATPGADKMDPNGLRAVAHLGGVTGMQKFVATGGLYDPADANGTKLSDYYQRFAGQGAQQGGGVAARTPGAVDVAGPGAGPGAPAGQPVGAQAGGGGQAAPAAAPVATGTASAQYQNAAELMRRANAVEMAAPADPRAKMMAQSLRQQAQLLMQTDSVSYDPTTGIGTKALTGERVSAAQPLAHYVWNGQAYVDTSGAHAPVTPPSPRLTMDKAGNVIQSNPGGGATVVAPVDTAGVAGLHASEAQGTQAGTAAGKSVKEMADLTRTSAQAVGNIDYGISQLDKAREGGINTGYFSGALTTVQSALKSLGLPTDKIPFINVTPDAVGNIQTARKTLAVVSGAILQQIIGKDSSITDAKIEAFIHAQPDITTDPQAVRRVLNWARSQFVYENELSKAGMQAASQTGMVPLNFLPKYISEHGGGPVYDPLSGEMKQPDGQSPGREPPAAVSSGPPKAGAIDGGYRFKGGDPSVKTNWERAQ